MMARRSSEGAVVTRAASLSGAEDQVGRPAEQCDAVDRRVGNAGGGSEADQDITRQQVEVVLAGEKLHAKASQHRPMTLRRQPVQQRQYRVKFDRKPPVGRGDEQARSEE